MSTRYISIEEINSIVAAIDDKKGIEILKKVRDNQQKETNEDRKEEQKYNTERSDLSQEDRQKRSDKIAERKAFTGFAKEDEVIGKNDDGKTALLERLVNTGLLLKGGFIPRDKERINSYKLTNEGYALLYLVERIEGKITSNKQEVEESQKEEPETRRLVTSGSGSGKSSSSRHT